MALIIPAQFKFKPWHLFQTEILPTQLDFVTIRTRKSSNFTSSLAASSFSTIFSHKCYHNKRCLNPRFCYKSSVFSRRASNDEGSIPHESLTSVSFLVTNFQIGSCHFDFLSPGQSAMFV